MGPFTPVQRFLLARGHGRISRRRERWVARSLSPERCFGLTSLLDPLTFMRLGQSGTGPSRTHPQCLHRGGIGEIPTEQPVPLLPYFCPASLIEQGQSLHMKAAARRNVEMPKPKSGTAADVTPISRSGCCSQMANDTNKICLPVGASQDQPPFSVIRSTPGVEVFLS